MHPVHHPLHYLSLALFALLAIVLLAVAGTVEAQTVSVTGGAVQSNDAPATYTSLTVSGTGPDGSRSTYSANAPLGLGSLTVSNSGAFNANANVAVTGNANFNAGTVVTLAGGTLSAGSIYFNGSIVQSGGNYSTNSLTFSNPMTYGPNDSISANGSLWAGSTMTLNKDIPVNYLTISGDQFGRTGGFVRNGYGYQAFQMHVNAFGHATFAENDSVSGSIWIDARGSTGLFPTSLTLHKNLTTNAYLSLSGTAATLNTNGYQASVGTLQLWQTNQTTSSNLTFRNLAVSEAGSLTLDRNLGVELLSLGDTGRIHRNGFEWTAKNLQIFRSGSLDYGPGTTVTDSVEVDSGTLSLHKDLVLASDLAISSTSSAVVRNGHSVTASTIWLNDGATFLTGLQDSLTGVRFYYGSGSVLEADAPLALDSFYSSGSTDSDGGTLRLNSFAGSWSGGSYALALDGNQQAFLQSRLDSGFLPTANAPGPVTIQYDATSGRTYVASTPIAVTTGSVAWNGDAVTVGAGDAGSFALDAGGTVLVRGLTVGADSGAGTLAVTSGTLLDKGNLDIGTTGPGTVTIGGAGTLAVTGTISRGENGTINLGPGGTLNVGFSGPTGDLATDLVNDGTLVFDRSNDFAVGQAITGTGQTIKLGPGTMTLTKTSDPGLVPLLTSLTVSEGTLDVGSGGNAELGIGRATAWGSADGGLTIDGGRVRADSVSLGFSAGRQGSITLTSGSLAVGQVLAVGAAAEGTGSLSVAGGSLTAMNASIGSAAGSSGSATVSGGSWVNSNILRVGHSGTGALTITGGFVGNTDGFVAANSLGAGVATVTGGTWSNSRNLTVGATGTLSIGGSGVVTVGDTFTREAGGSVSLNPGGTLKIGTGGTTGSMAGNFTNNGTLVFDRSTSTTYSGTVAGTGAFVKQGTGRLTLTGVRQTVNQDVRVLAGELWSGTTGRTALTVGQSGSGSLLVAGGTVSSGQLQLGLFAGSAGSVTVTSGSLFATNMIIGGTGSGSLRIEGGDVAVGTSAGSYSYAARFLGGRGDLTMTGGRLQILGGIALGINGTSTVILSGGTMSATGYIGLGANYTSSSRSVVTVNGGNMIAGSIEASGTMTLSAGTVTGTSGITVSEAFDYYDEAADKAYYLPFSLAVTGGTMTAAGDGIFLGTGTATINGGSLITSAATMNGGSVIAVRAGTWANEGDVFLDNPWYAAPNELRIDGSGVVTIGGALRTGSASVIDLGPGGTLQIGTGGTTGSLDTSLANNGTLAFNRSDAWSHALTISGSGSVVKLGVGTLTLAGTNSYSGGTQVLAGTLKASNTSSFGTGTIVLSSGATLDLANLTFSNTIVNNGGTILNGAGYSGTQAVSSGTATITGPTTGTVVVDAPGATAQIAGPVTGSVTASNGGTVVITGSVAPTAQVSVGAGSTVAIGNGATVAQPTLANAGKFAVANTTGSVVLPTAITGTGSFEKTGAGSVQLTGSSNFTGGSTIASGQVVVQNAKALGSGGVTVSSGGRLLIDGVDLNLGGAAVALITGAELKTTSGARVTVAANSDLSGVRSTSPAAATAAILAGTAVSGTLATTWTTTADPTVKSEVLQLKTPTSASNPFVLSLSYGLGLDPAGLFLGWNDPLSGDWVNAVVGNQLLPGMNAAAGGQLGYLGSFTAFQGFYGTNLASYLGAYGRDDTSRTVWAVINHNSEFAVTQVTPVPEPGTWALALAGLAGAGLTLRRRTRSRR